MSFADLHIHSKFSRATGKDATNIVSFVGSCGVRGVLAVNHHGGSFLITEFGMARSSGTVD